MTVTEMAKMGKACIMIPSPNVTDNHQYKNAKVLSDAGAVLLLEEKELTEGRIVGEVKTLLENAAHRRAMSENISAFAGEDACELIYREILRLVK